MFAYWNKQTHYNPMKKNLTLMLVCLFAITGTAIAKSLVITMKNNTKIYYLLGGETNPMMRFIDGQVTVDADNYTISNIKNFYISETDDPSAIEEVLTKHDINYSANTLVINSSNINSVKVYTMNGTQVNAEIQNSGDIIAVDLNSLPQGTYIINAGGSSFKVMKK